MNLIRLRTQVKQTTKLPFPTGLSFQNVTWISTNFSFFSFCLEISHFLKFTLLTGSGVLTENCEKLLSSLLCSDWPSCHSGAQTGALIGRAVSLGTDGRSDWPSLAGLKSKRLAHQLWTHLSDRTEGQIINWCLTWNLPSWIKDKNNTMTRPASWLVTVSP